MDQLSDGRALPPAHAADATWAGAAEIMVLGVAWSQHWSCFSCYGLGSTKAHKLLSKWHEVL